MSTASTYERYLLKLMNDYRVANGLEPLTGNTVLHKVAEDHSRWQIDSRNLGSHINFDDPDLFFPDQRMKVGGYPDQDSHFDETTTWSPIRRGGGNNPEVHKAMIEAAFEQILGSPGHLASLRSPNAKDVGIGLIIDNITWPGGNPNDPRDNGPGIVITINYGGTTADTSHQADTLGPHPATGPSPTPMPEPVEPNPGEVKNGTSGDDTLSGGAGDDTLNGLDGDDVLVSSDGVDYLNGGEGVDTADYFFAQAAVNVYLNHGKTITSEGNDYLTSIENVIGSDFDDRLIGNSDANVLNGGAGNDIMKGKGGNDTFFGGAGNDKIRGGSGADRMEGGTGSDTLIGLDGNDTLDGGAGNDFIYGGKDNDALTGGVGADKLRGNLGNDQLDGGTGADDLRGGGGNDMLNGGADNDFLLGENGNDTLFGGAGDDAMNGGAGADTFVYKGSSDGGGGFDRVKDFGNGTDTLDLSSFDFANFAEVQALASNTGDNMRINFDNGDVLYLENFKLANFTADDVIL